LAGQEEVRAANAKEAPAMPENDKRRSAPATLRNREPILQILRPLLPDSGLVLEVASGTGQHVVHFARELPSLTWQPSDPAPEARQSIAGWVAVEGLGNVRAPLNLHAAADEWPVEHSCAVICINMTHISPWSSTVGLMRGAGRILDSGALLYLYGPYRRPGQQLEPSNAAFDLDLRARNPQWGLRALDDVAKCAHDHGLGLGEVIEMPARNLSLVFRRK
jgi:hypothetical protein